MPAGLETITSDGHLQLLTDGLYFKLEQKVVLDNTGWSQHGSNGSYKDISFPVDVADAPMLALASQAACWHRQISSSANSVTFRVYRTSSGNYSVTCWLFSKKLPAVDTMPFALYNAQQQCIFTASYLPVKPLGQFKGGVYTGVDRAGRTLAFVPQTRRTSQYSLYSSAGFGSCIMGGNIQGYQHYLQTGWTEDALICWGDNITSANLNLQVGPIPYQCSPSSTPPPSSSNGTTVTTGALIIDVTNY